MGVERDGFVALTIVDRDRALSQLREVFRKPNEFPYWEAFIGGPKDVLPECAQIISEIVLPDGWTLSGQTHPDERLIHAAQVLNRRKRTMPPRLA